MVMTWKKDIFRSGKHGGYLVNSGFFLQCKFIESPYFCIVSHSILPISSLFSFSPFCATSSPFLLSSFALRLL